MFASPEYFLLLILLIPLAWLLFTKSPRQAVNFSSVSTLKNLPTTWRQRLAWLPNVLTLMIVALIIVALARPRDGREQTIVQSEGIAIELIVDRSGSMQAMDFKIDGESVDRLTAIKHVAGKFVAGNEQDSESPSLASGDNTDEGATEKKLAGRVSDLVGLVTFAGYADAVTPPTLDHGYVLSQMNRVRIVRIRSEDGTAIGDAISLAVEKLTALSDEAENKIESKVAILLTDGSNTAGEIEPKQAAELAEKLGVRIYTIGVGTRGKAPVPVTDPFSGRRFVQMMQVDIDEETLQEIASITGGKYFRATDTESLANIYAEIDELEKTKVETQRYTDYRELSVQGFRYAGWNVPPIIALAAVLLVARILLSHLVFTAFA